MKNKKSKVLLLVMILLTLTGCGNNNYIKDENNKIVINKETGQNLQKDIYCKPSPDTESYRLYEQYQDQLKFKLDELPSCENFKINSNKTSSLWQFLFVKPLAYLILKLGMVFKSIGMTKAYLGVSLVVIALLIRLIILPFNIKTQNQSRRMQQAAPEIQKLERKYANRTDQEAMLLKSQETMNIYKKYKVSPFLSCLLALIQLPLFFAFLQAIYKIPTIYEGSVFGWNLGTTPSVGIFQNHQYSFIILILLIIFTTYFSFNTSMKQSQNMSAMPDAGKQMKIMVIVMTVLISFTSFSLPTAIALYWIVTYAFIIIQTLIVNLINNKKVEKEKQLKKSKSSIQEKLRIKEGIKYGKNK